MKSNLSTNPFGAFDGASNPDGSDFNANAFSPPSLAPALPIPAQAPTLPAESAEALSAQDGPGGPGSVVSEAAPTGGIAFNLVFDAAAMAATSAAAAFRAGIEQAASILSATITNPITVTIDIDYSGTGGGASSGPTGGLFESYSTVRAALVGNAATGDTVFNSLPTGSTIQGQSAVAVWDAQLKLLGMALPSNYTGVDAVSTFATDIDPSLLIGVALHELTHALGRVPYGMPDGPQPDIFDFYRFTSAGTRLFTDNIPASASYFSLDGGNTKIADYGLFSDPSDSLNPGPTQLGSPYGHLTPNDPFNEIYGPGTVQGLRTIDKGQLDALGYNTQVPWTVIESYGSTSLVQAGNDYFLNSNSTGTGPEVIYGAGPLTVGEFAWTPIGAEQTSTGYEIALKIAGSGLYTVWKTDSSGNVTSDPIGNVSGNSPVLEALETSFHQDLNGDGVIGISGTTIESFGSTSLVQAGNDYFLNSNSTGTGPEVIYGAAPLTVGEFAWTPIGAEQTSTGYEIALKIAGSGLYTVWNTDSSGNVTYDPIGNVSGNSPVLEALETSFHQDLNGDGVIGIPGATIESFGSTSLVQAGNDYFLDSNSTGTGPEVIYGAGPLTVGEFVWTPIGAEQTSTGYEIALKNAGSGQYTVWNTDSSGNVTYDPIGNVSGNSPVLEALETSFHQDLNGDGVIGIPGAIESSGSTSLVQAGNNYFLDSNSTGTGPEVIYGAAPLTVGEFVWTPIGAEQTSTGYEIALKNAGSGLYTVWNTDSSGSVTYDPIGNVSGSSSVLEALEPSFHQDLNGDGVIGVPGSHTIASPATTPAASVSVVNSDGFVFSSVSGAGVTSSTPSIGTTAFGGLPAGAFITSAPSVSDAQAAMPHPLLQLAEADPLSHQDSPIGAFIDLHAGHFLIQ